jgi:hypothetical protein
MNSNFLITECTDSTDKRRKYRGSPASFFWGRILAVLTAKPVAFRDLWNLWLKNSEFWLVATMDEVRGLLERRE